MIFSAIIINMATKKTSEPKKIPAGELQSPKGMQDMMNEKYYQWQGLFEKAQEVAVYYGFEPIKVPHMEDIRVFEKSLGEGTDALDKEMYTLKTKGGDHLALRPEGTAGVMRAYLENGMRNLPQPVSLYYSGSFFRHDKPQRGRYREFHQFGLEVIGTEKSIADALIIQTFVKIIEEAGCPSVVVDINSIGDKDSRAAYLKALVVYYRKHINQLPAIDRDRLKTNPLRILDSKDPKTIAINEEAPDSISYLTPSAKKHFKEVLEYLDEANIIYRINKCLVRGLDYYSHTVFEVIEQSNNPETNGLALGGGGRYDGLGKMLGSKKDIPAVGAALGMDRIIESPWCVNLAPRIMAEPKFYLIQLGFEAKMKTLAILEILRKAKCPVYQSLSKDKLGGQLAQAEKMNVPYVIIFGQREAMDGTVIIRNMKDRSQDTVKIDELMNYIKKLK
jgi:histidyl-tRNA synthetase